MDYLVLALFGMLVGLLVTQREIKLTITHIQKLDQPVVEPKTDEEAFQEIEEQQILQSAQSYLDRYLKEGN